MTFSEKVEAANEIIDAMDEWELNEFLSYGYYLLGIPRTPKQPAADRNAKVVDLQEWKKQRRPLL